MRLLIVVATASLLVPAPASAQANPLNGRVDFLVAMHSACVSMRLNASEEIVANGMFNNGINVSHYASQGDTMAQILLGMWHLSASRPIGNLTPEPYLGRFWLNKAVNSGDAFAQFSLGMFHLGGCGVEQDPAISQLLLRAARQRRVDNVSVGVQSQLMLAMLYAVGVGVPHDRVEAYMWALIAMDDGDGDRVPAELQEQITDVESEIYNMLTRGEVDLTRNRAKIWDQRHPHIHPSR